MAFVQSIYHIYVHFGHWPIGLSVAHLRSLCISRGFPAVIPSGTPPAAFPSPLPGSAELCPAAQPPVPPALRLVVGLPAGLPVSAFPSPQPFPLLFSVERAEPRGWEGAGGFPGPAARGTPPAGEQSEKQEREVYPLGTRLHASVSPQKPTGTHLSAR